MVADQAEGGTLGEDCRFIIERAVAEVKSKPRGDAIAVCDLNEITRGEGGAFERFENEKSVEGSLCSTDGNGVGEQERRYEKACREQEKEPGATIYQRDCDDALLSVESSEFDGRKD